MTVEHTVAVEIAIDHAAAAGYGDQFPGSSGPTVEDVAQPIAVAVRKRRVRACGFSWVFANKEIDAKAVDQEPVGLGDQLILVTRVGCDRRVIMIATSLPKKVAKSYHAAIVKNLRCKPERGGLDAPTIEVVDLKLPSTYQRTVVPGLPYSTVAYSDDSAGVVYTVQVRPDARRRRRVDLEVELGKQGIVDLAIERKGDVTTFSGKLDDREVAGFAIAKDCVETTAMVMIVVIAGSEQAQASALAVTNNATCLATPR